VKIRLGTVAHFSIAVRDPERAAALWTSLFDLEEYRRTPARVVVGNDAIVLVLSRGQPTPDKNAHLAFRVDDLAAIECARDRMRALDVDLEDPGDEIGPVAPGSTSVGLWFHDPDGYRWELFFQEAQRTHA
jgi:catechol 2,3-dioxygenase-like lactoylglutathione lyase family enzyme